MSNGKELDPKILAKFKATVETVGVALKDLGIMTQQYDIPSDLAEGTKVYMNTHTKEFFNRLNTKGIDTKFNC